MAATSWPIARIAIPANLDGTSDWFGAGRMDIAVTERAALLWSSFLSWVSAEIRSKQCALPSTPTGRDAGVSVQIRSYDI